MPELVFFRRGDEVLRFALESTRVVLGRGETADVVIPDPSVSRLQAALINVEGRWTLEDLSGNGTLICGERQRQIALTDGVDIGLGQWRAIFRERAVAELSAQATLASLEKTQTQPSEGPALKYQPVQLRVRQGHGETVHKLSNEGFTVGGEAGNDLVITDRFISARHLKIARREGVFHVLDRSSTNGTFLGNVRLFEAEVPLHTTLRVGQAELVFEPAAAAKQEQAYAGLIGSDPAMRHLAELIERVAPSSAPVLIFGESGTGKELVAQAVHQRSSRSERPFIPVNCAAISKELIESELFGHEKGAFTGAEKARRGAFEEADGGSLFLDEIGELAAELQAKLLRVLESGEIKRVGASRPITVDARIVAATNRDLLSDVREGRFREDLYYRLCVVPLQLPPLRSRKGDVVGLAEHFVRRFAPHGQTVRFTPSALDRMQTHHWPGNVRELRNVVHRSLLLRKGPLIDASDLTFDVEINRETGIAVPELPQGMTLEQMLEKLERQIIETALKRCNDNRERVARELGVARSTLFKRLKQWGLTRQDEAE